MEHDEIKVKKSGSLGRFFKRTVAVVTTAAVFGGVAGGVFNLVAKDKLKGNEKSSIGSIVNEAVNDIETVEKEKSSDNNDGVIQTVTTNENTNIEKGTLDVSDIVENAMPSIVAINVKATKQVDQGMFGTYEYEASGAGSGFIIGENDDELLIATNNHVVSSADTVSVEFIDGESCDAKVKGLDSGYDVAVVAVPLENIPANTREKIKIAKLGSSDELKVGEQVVVIGNALGYGQSVTTGIVSAKERTTTTNDLPLIQTDAAINPGNSGGAMLNMKGEVVGINSSKYASTEVEGVCYAIPISEVNDIINSLSLKETRDKVDEKYRASLGIKCGTITSEIAEMYGVPEGVLVSEVIDGSAAKNAGIKKNYIITGFDGQRITSAEQLIEILEYYRAGEQVEVKVQYLEDDEYVEKTIPVVLGRKN
ncbi:MAG: trypsin-like peptidase domain-containing protein [Lachnospiraceae bacterium]|nr:trypsin-like peptidase domain-containing protein [Lachnospiraceae bacterium]